MLKARKLIIFTIVLTISLSGCGKGILPNRMEISDLMMISAAGVDKDPNDPNNICVTIISKKNSDGQNGKSAGGEGSAKSVILSNEAETFNKAIHDFQTSSDKQMFWGHVEYYLFGEEAAKDGIAKYLDFLARDHEIRGNARIYVIEGTTAKEFIEKSSTGEYFMPDRLKAIGENSRQVAGSQELELFQFMQWLNNKYSCAAVPSLNLKPKTKEKKEGEESAMDIDLGGYSIFKDLKLVSTIDKQMTRGENFLLNRVITGVIQVKDPEGNMVGLEIIDTNTKIKPKFEKGELKQINIKVKLSSNIGEVHSTSSIFTKDIINFMTNEQSKVIKDEIEKVISRAKENNTDFINIANVIETKHPVKWVKYKDRWDQIFPELPIIVDVESKINRTYDIREPNGVVEEEHK